MISTISKIFVSFIIILHCVGVTQLVSSLSKDKSAFIGMVSMSEEETKKEKECKDDISSAKDIQLKWRLPNLNASLNDERIYCSDSYNRIYHQFVIESPTPPPDFTA